MRVSGEPGERSVTWSLPGETPAVFAAIKAQAGADYVLKGELAEMGTILFDSKDGETSIIGAFNGETVSIMEATNQDLTK